MLFRLFLLIFWVFGPGCLALYEDQVGKFDWRQQFIGRIRHVLRPSLWQDHQNLIVSTESNALSALYLRNGSINWRHLFNEEVAHLTGAFDRDSQGACPVITVSGDCKHVRCWTSEGLLLEEFNLPQSFVNEFDRRNHRLFFDDIRGSRPSNDKIQFVRINIAKYTVEAFTFTFTGSEFKLQSKQTISESWVKDPSLSCVVASNNLICSDMSKHELHVLSLESSSSSSKVFPLSKFGLKTEKLPNSLKLHKLPFFDDKTTTISTSSESRKVYLSLDLGGDGIAILTLQSNELDLVKILPDAVKVTIIPLMSQEQAQDNLEFGLAVLYVKKNSIKYEREEDGKNGEKVFAAKLVVFHLTKWTEIAALSAQQFLLEFGDKNSISPIGSSGKLVKRLENEWTIDRFEILPIRIINMNSRTGRNQQRFTYKMLITTVDGTTIVMNLSGKINWSREEALAEIVSAQMMDLPLSETDASIEQEYSQHANIVQSFVTRIQTQISQLASLVKSIQRRLISKSFRRKAKTFKNDDPDFSIQNDDESEGGFEQDSDEDDAELVRDYFGIHKVVILRTKIGRLFSMDSLSGKIYWSKYEPLLEQQTTEVKLPIYVQRTSAHFPFEAICTILSDSYKDPSVKSLLYSFNPFTGRAITFERYDFSIVQALQISSTHDTEYRKPIVFVDNANRVHLYPDEREVFASVASKYYLLIANKTTNTLTGYSFAKSTVDNLNVLPVWTFVLPTQTVSNLKIVFKRDHEQVHSQGMVLGDRRVLYKYSNPNLVAVAWESVDSTDGKPQITVYLLDAVTGNVLHSVVHRRARAPLQIVHSENWVLYSFHNEKLRRNEIATIEMYEGLEQVNATAFSSLDRDIRLHPIIYQQGFIFPTGISFMTDTETQKGITYKHILIALPTGGLLELPRQFLNPRRPIKPSPETQEEGLIPYIPELPVPSEALINYNQTIFGVRGIHVAPTSLESTSLVFVYGLDIFYARVTPSKTFDILKDDFDFLLITFVLVGLVVASYLAKFVADKKSLNQVWK